MKRTSVKMATAIILCFAMMFGVLGNYTLVRAADNVLCECGHVHGIDEICSEAGTYALNNSSYSCLIYIAMQEIGYHEKASDSQLDDPTANAGSANYTKYGAWYGSQAAWCHMFVSWCANQAKIGTDIIPEEASTVAGRQFFINANRYENSAYKGGTYTPQRGDIIYFKKGSTTAVTDHVGIVESVVGNTVHTIEGNASDQVMRRSYSTSSSEIVGYGRPAYGSSSHKLVAYGRNYKCSNCGMITSSLPEISSIAGQK